MKRDKTFDKLSLVNLRLKNLDWIKLKRIIE